MYSSRKLVNAGVKAAFEMGEGGGKGGSGEGGTEGEERGGEGGFRCESEGF